MPGGITGKGWRPGQSGNPGGRPRGESITATLRRLVEDREHNGRPIQELLAEVLLKEALKGKYPFAREVLERLDGPVAQRHQVEVARSPARLLAEMPREDKEALIARAGLGHLLTPAAEGGDP